jgi:hypothetical protein
MKITFIILAAICLMACKAQSSVCEEQHVVKKIVSINYRSAVVLLDNGKELSVYQAILKEGGPITLYVDCVTSERQKCSN